MQKYSSKPFVAALLMTCLTATMAHAATTASHETSGTQDEYHLDAQEATKQAQQLYDAMVGEFNISAGNYTEAFPFILKAARASSDDALFERSILVALQNKDFNTALNAAQEWQIASPGTRDAYRYALDILVNMQGFDQMTPYIQGMLLTSPDAERAEIIAALGQYLSPHATSIEPYYPAALEPWIKGQNPKEAAAAWLSIGIIQFHAKKPEEAFTAVSMAHTLDPQAIEPALFAVDMINTPAPQKSEALVLSYLNQPDADTKVRLVYVQALLQRQRMAPAMEQLEIAIIRPDAPPVTWYLLGSLQMEAKQYQAGRQTLKTYLEKTEDDNTADTRNNKERSYLELAQSEVELGQVEAAQGWIEQIIDPTVKTPAQKAYIGMLLKVEKYDLALKIANQLPETTNTERAQRNVLYAQILIQAQRWRQAYTFLDKVNAQNIIFDPDLLYLQSLAATKTGQFSKAESILRGLIRTDPKNATAYNALGYTLANRNERLDEAKILIEKAFTLEPDNATIIDSLGWVEYKLGNQQTALKLLENAYKAYPNPEVAAHLGEVLWVSGQRDRALAVWKLAFMNAPKNSDLKNTFKRLRVSEATVRNFEIPTQDFTASNANGDVATNAATIIEYLLANKEWQALYDLLTPVSAINDTAPTLLQVHATAANALGKPEEAEVLYRRAIQLAPDDAMVYNNLGYMLADRGIRLDEAKTLIEKANTLKPDNVYILDSLGWVAFKMNHTEQALQTLRKAYRINPTLTEIGLHLGEVLWHTGQKAEALLIWKDIQFRDPNNADLKKVLQRLAITLP